MIEHNTVFILGAGASHPYGYPTGAVLRHYICKQFPEKYSQLMTHSSQGVAEAKQFAETFFKSSTPSIDLFLARNPHFSEIGKIAITMAILEAEDTSRFREDHINTELDWYSYFYHRMTEGLIGADNVKDFAANKLSFITFNYDRSLEHFLCESLLNSFFEIGGLYVDVLKKIPLIHVYGKVDILPWEAENSIKATPYRGHYDYPMIERMAKNTKTIYEISNQKNKEIENLIAYADRIFFLGFGYAKENLDAIGIPTLLDGKQNLFGTAYGLVENEIKEIRQTLSTRFEVKDPRLANPVIEPCDCRMLLRSHL